MFIAPRIFTLENVSVDLHLLITGTKTTRAPFEFEQKVIFSYKDDQTKRFVGIAFDYDQFKDIHPFFRNENGVYMFILPYDEIPAEVTSFNYRLIADGLWLPDPSNPDTFRATSGIYLSHMSLRNKMAIQSYPQINENEKTVTFYYYAPASNYVFLAGTFNNWDPFMLSMKENAAGTYSLTIRLPAGTHYYYFLFNGEKRRDVKNPVMATDPEGFTVSAVTIP